MTTTTQTLSSWLLSQIEADEAAARDAVPGPWRAALWQSTAHPPTTWRVDPEPDGSSNWMVADALPGNHDAERTAISAANAAHIARHDPAHVLAVCRAHRAIVEALTHIATTGPADRYNPGDEALWATLRILAAAYADRCGYRDEWRLS